MRMIVRMLSLLQCLFAATGCLGAQSSRPAESTVFQPKSGIDLRVREFVDPVRVLWTSDAETVEGAETLLQKRDGQATLDASNPCTLRSGGAVLLDFGRELHGGVQITAWNNKNGSVKNKPVRVHVRLGESATEAMSDGLYEGKNPTNDHVIRDTEVLIPWLVPFQLNKFQFC